VNHRAKRFGKAIGQGQCPFCDQPMRLSVSTSGIRIFRCDPSGIQVLIRGPPGIAALDGLVDRASGEGLWTRVKDMERRYHLKSPAWGSGFWIEPDLVETSIFDRSLKGVRSPQENCGAPVAWKDEQ